MKSEEDPDQEPLASDAESFLPDAQETQLPGEPLDGEGGPPADPQVESDSFPDRAVEPASLDGDRRKAILEALLFVSEQPLTLERMAAVLGGGSKKGIRSLLDELNQEYRDSGRAFEIVEVAQGYQVRTRAEFGRWIGKLKPQRYQRLSRAALESLAIVAYRQPLTRAEIESIRGVDTGAVLGSLLERKLIRILGRKEVPGRPILYGTSQEFLELFGLKNLSSLPTLREIEDMFKESGAAATTEEGAETAEAPATGLESPSAAAVTGEGEGEAAAGPALPAGDLDEGQEGRGGGDDWDTSDMDLLLRSTKVHIVAYQGDDLGVPADLKRMKERDAEPAAGEEAGNGQGDGGGKTDAGTPSGKAP